MAKPFRYMTKEIGKYVSIHTYTDRKRNRERSREREREEGEEEGRFQRGALGNRVTDIALRQPDIQSFSGYPRRSGIYE